MLETAKQYALEILNALEVCVSKDILADMIVCDWKINSGCEYDNQCCDPVSCCDEVQFEAVTCSLSFESENVYTTFDIPIETGNGEDNADKVEIQIPIGDFPQICNITIKEL